MCEIGKPCKGPLAEAAHQISIVPKENVTKISHFTINVRK